MRRETCAGWSVEVRTALRCATEGDDQNAPLAAAEDAAVDNLLGLTFTKWLRRRRRVVVEKDGRGFEAQDKPAYALV